MSNMARSPGPSMLHPNFSYRARSPTGSLPLASSTWSRVLLPVGVVVLATVATVSGVGAVTLIVGLAKAAYAFQIMAGRGNILPLLLLDVLYVVARFVTFENPLLAAALLTPASVLAGRLGIVGIVPLFSKTEATSWF
jgi:uncharacterized membrane protein HdeD (DUF308 family)